ncbi:MAG: type II secretion system F family protein [Pirellula sp.]|jgi:type II secretory pathway component PulF
MKFHYEAKDRQGNSTRGQFEGESALAVRQKLRTQGLFVLSLVSADSTFSRRPVGGSASGSPSILGKNFNRVNGSDLIVALSQLSIMCHSGDDLAEALRTVANQCQSPKLRQVLLNTYEDVAQGVKFSAALARHPGVFSQSLVAALAAGEQAGRVVDVLDRTTRMMRKDQSLRSTIASMLMYPAVLCTVTLLVIFSMLFFVLPQFATVFRDMDRPVPPLTNILLSIGTGVKENWIIVVTILGTLLGAGIAFRKHPQVRNALDHAILHMVIVKDSARALLTGRIFRLLGTMLENGVPLLESVRLCRNATSNRLFQKMFDSVEHQILEGEGMSETFVNAAFLPPGAAHMIATGERAGKLPSVLQSVGEYFEDEGERRLRTLVKMLEPAIIIGLGAIVALVVLSIVLPLLDVTTASR